MSDPWPSPTPRDQVVARALRRGRHLRRLRHLVVAGAVTGVVAAGVAGYALGTSGAVDVVGEPVRVLPDATATYYACPAEEPLGRLHRGDRVLLTGQSEDGEWIEVRSPSGLDRRVWISAAVVTPDAVVDLPRTGCRTDGDDLEVADGRREDPTPSSPDPDGDPGSPGSPGSTEPSGSPEGSEPSDPSSPDDPSGRPDGSTPEEGPGDPTTPGPSSTGPRPSDPRPPGPGPTRPRPPTTRPPAPTTRPPTTPPPDTTGPSVTDLRATVGSINEQGSEFCVPPHTTEVSAVVSDPSGLRSVTVHWSFTRTNGQVASGSRPMAVQSGRHRAVIGPFPATTLSTPTTAVDIGWSVRAVDDRGNVTTVAASGPSDVTLHNC